MVLKVRAPMWRFLGKATWCLLLVCATAPRASLARSMQAKRVWLGGGMGFDLTLPTPLATQHYGLDIVASLERTLSSTASISLEGGATVGATPRWDAFANFVARKSSTGTALSPYLQLGAGGGRIYDVVNSRLNFGAARIGVGLDYFFGAQILGGLAVRADLGGTAGGRPAFFGAFSTVLRIAWDVGGERLET